MKRIRNTLGFDEVTGSRAAGLWWSALGTVGLAGAVLLGTTGIAAAHGHTGLAASQAQMAMGASGATTPAITSTGGTGSAMGGTGASQAPASNTAGAAGTGMAGMAGMAGAGTGTAMSGMSGMAGMAGAAGTAGTTNAAAAGICPNVAGATTMSDGMVMAPVPPGPPTAAQQAAANQLVAETTQDIAQYANLSAAEAAGYVPATRTTGQMTHYADWQVVQGKDVLDPEHPSSLMYANTVNGPVLVGAMYLGPGPCQPGPDVGGSLTQWHAHDNLCVSSTHQVVGRVSNGSCASGNHNTSTYFMLHVWTAPSLASQFQFQADLPPSALQPIVESGQA